MGGLDEKGLDEEEEEEEERGGRGRMKEVGED